VHIFVKSGSIYVKPKPNDHYPILHISSNSYFTIGNAPFCDICLFVCHLPYMPFVYAVSNAVENSYFMGILLLTVNE